ncbi:hypothetical protein RI129_011309 [Pyrocoelia pectoralis]|uniref:Luciferin 4-monooxygenase n=1 Tax=Pyrocoelia pectoralis TaxID=417401 RepID=A0AAN7V595_9COLE
MNSNYEEEFVIKGPKGGYVLEPKGMGYAFFQNMSRNSNLVAQVDGVSGVKDTYGNLLERCISTALRMRQIGIKPKDVITMCSLNHLNSCVPVIAALFVGAVPACLDPLLSLIDIVHLLKQVTPKLVFVDQKSIELIENALGQAEVETNIVMFGESEKYMEFREFVTENQNGDFLPYEIGDNRETAFIMFSSGTTGKPKGICLSHRGLLGQGNNLIGLLFETTLIYASYYWISSVSILFAAVQSGSCRVIVPPFVPRTFWKLVDRFSVTCIFLAPTQTIAILKNGRPKDTNTAHLHGILIGGGSLSAQNLKELRELFPGTYSSITFGQTECSGLSLDFNRSDPKEVALMLTKPGSSGLLCPDFSCKIVDPDSGKVLGPNQKGEICFKGDCVMNGYYNLDSSEAWYADGWMRSGDIGYYDEDRCFYVVDRIKEMLKFNSYHIAPSFIENTLMTHSKIRMAVVIGIPSDEHGDLPLGVVCLKDGSEDVTEEDIVKYVEERIDDRYRLRGGVKFVNTFPLTVSGKIRKNYLKQLVLSEQI